MTHQVGPACYCLLLPATAWFMDDTSGGACLLLPAWLMDDTSGGACTLLCLPAWWCVHGRCIGGWYVHYVCNCGLPVGSACGHGVALGAAAAAAAAAWIGVGQSM